jgi:hypothetical protein
MCIRITRELKTVFEQQVRIGLWEKIGFPVFVKIMTLLGYLNSAITNGYMLPTMSPKEEQLVVLAWQTVRSRGESTTEIVGNGDYAQYKQNKQIAECSSQAQDCFDYVTFENFAMLLNLINNVYIKNNV